MSDSDFHLDHQYVVSRRTKQRAYVVPASEWTRLIEKLEKAKDSSRFYDSAAWALLGLTPGLVIAGLSFTQPLRLGVWAFAAASLVCGLLALKFSREHQADRITYLLAVIDDMRALAGVEELNSAGKRRTYRSIAYLRFFMEDTLKRKFSPPEGISGYDLISDTERVYLQPVASGGRALPRASLQVSPDWPQGQSGAYARQLLERLIVKLPEEARPTPTVAA